jgi:menaquinol-cytochrome c reductase iron-sulfur subunit
MSSSESPVEKQVLPRRSWIKGTVGVLLAGLSLSAPVGASVAFFLSPLFKKKTNLGAAEGFVKVADMNALPNDGSVKQFPVLADLVDAWNKFPQTPVGAVFLRKMDDGKIQAFNARCPHLGCFIQAEAAKKGYACHCHAASFDINGQRQNQVSPRPMDELKVEIRNKNDIWIQYQDYRPGIAEKIPTT